MPMERHAVDIEAMIRDLAARMQEKAVARDVTLALDLPSDIGAVNGDQRRLVRAIEHVVDNSLSFVSRGGRVLIHAEGTPKSVRIVVSDDGPGIDQKSQAQLFDAFARFGRDGDAQSAGLGLPLVKQFVEAHGGTVALVSELGQGTIITIDLPRDA